MKPLLLLLTVISLLSCPIATYGQDEGSPSSPAEAAVAAAPGSWGAGPAAAPTKELATDVGDLKPMKLRDGMSFRQARKLGASIRNIRRILIELQRNDLINREMSASEIAQIVAETLIKDNPQAFGDPQLDWDRLMEIIEWIIELLMKFLPLIISDNDVPSDWHNVDLRIPVALAEAYVISRLTRAWTKWRSWQNVERLVA